VVAENGWKLLLTTECSCLEVVSTLLLGQVLFIIAKAT